MSLKLGKINLYGYGGEKNVLEGTQKMSVTLEEVRKAHRDKSLHEDLHKILSSLREKRNFNGKEWIQKKVAIFNDYMKKCNLKGVVLSVSGGVDSAVTMALCCEAKKQKDSVIEKVVGIAQPIASTAKIQNRAYELGEQFGAEIVTVDQTEIWNSLKSTVEKACPLQKKGTDYSSGQLKSYMRTPVNYYMAQLYNQEGIPTIVMGTGNFDEDGYLFYFSKAGDGVADVQLINDLHKSEVFEVGYELGVPKSILVAAPSADLWDGQEDEDEIGTTYDFIELYTELLKLPSEEKQKYLQTLSSEAKKQFDTLEKLVVGVHNRNKHKEKYPINL